MYRRHVLFVVSLFILTATTATAIFMGQLSEDETVLALGKWNPDGSHQSSFIATGNVIEYKGIDQRCVLTARHVAPCKPGKTPPCTGADALWHRAVLEQDVRELTGPQRDQLVARTGTVLPEGDGHDTYRDLRINWLQNKGSTSTNQRIELEDYTSRKIDEAPVAWLPPEWEGAHYIITGYGDNADSDAERGVRRHGWPVLKMLEDERPADLGGGARLRTSSNPSDHDSECYGDSGAAALVTQEVFSAVSMGSINACDPRDRKDYWDPNPYEGVPPDSGANPEIPKNHVDAVALAGETVLHSILNSKGEIAQPPEATAWEEVGNWEQIQYQISRVCTKDLEVRISGKGQVRGTLDTALPWYDTERLNHHIYCVGDGSLDSAIGDCAEAVHQPESILLEAEVTDSSWEFEAWEPAYTAAPGEGPPVEVHKCPCEGLGPVCGVDFESIGKYTPNTSDDHSLCIAKFRQVQPPPPPPCNIPPCPVSGG